MYSSRRPLFVAGSLKGCITRIVYYRYEHYGRALRNKGLRVVPVEGDGNCLFRSVSHQVYGDDSHHRLVRARCMDYMEVRAQRQQ